MSKNYELVIVSLLSCSKFASQFEPLSSKSKPAHFLHSCLKDLFKNSGQRICKADLFLPFKKYRLPILKVFEGVDFKFRKQ